MFDTSVLEGKHSDAMISQFRAWREDMKGVVIEKV
jgi:hypothetical protein